MEPKDLQRSQWKIPVVEAFLYQIHFCNYFNKHNPDFNQEMASDLLPLHFVIFGKHEKTTPSSSEYNWMLSKTIIEKAYLEFFLQIEIKLKTFNFNVINQKDFSKEKLRINTDMLLDKIISIIKRHNLFFGNDDKYIEPWLVHSILCQIEAGIPYITTALRQIFNDLPIDILSKLWQELPELERIYYMKNQEDSYRELGVFDEFKEKFDSVDIFMKTYPFQTLPPPRMFKFRPYNIYENTKNYEKVAVNAFKEHIKNYISRMTNALEQNGFKQNRKENYDQTEWLVLWNSGIKSKQDILIDIGSNGDEGTINRAFRKLKKYGLPVRKRNGKNKSEKIP
jgi:hypothetical protein